MKLFYKQGKNSGFHIHFSALCACARLEMWVPDLGLLGVRDQFRFYLRAILVVFYQYVLWSIFQPVISDFYLPADFKYCFTSFFLIFTTFPFFCWSSADSTPTIFNYFYETFRLYIITIMKSVSYIFGEPANNMKAVRWFPDSGKVCVAINWGDVATVER